MTAITDHQRDIACWGYTLPNGLTITFSMGHLDRLVTEDRLLESVRALAEKAEITAPSHEAPTGGHDAPQD